MSTEESNSVDDRFIKVIERKGERRLDKREWRQEGDTFVLSGRGLSIKYIQGQKICKFMGYGIEHPTYAKLYAIEELGGSNRNFYFKIM